MPTEFMDERRLSSLVCSPSATSSFFLEENQHPSQRQVGSWKPESMPDHYGSGGMQLMTGSKLVPSSPLERVRANGGSSVILPEISQPVYMKDQLSIGYRAVGMERKVGLSNSWRAASQNSVYQANPSLQTASLRKEEDAMNMKKPDFENSLFSSSFSDIFDKKLRLSSRDSPFGQSSMLNSNFEEDESFESLKEVEAQTIGNLLPDDDDLLSGVVNDLGFITHRRSEEDIDDDLFCSGGGMELEKEGKNSAGKTSDYNRIYDIRQRGHNCGLTNGHAYSSSRTLIVRNIHDNVEDNELRALFEQYGDIYKLHTTFKSHGFVLVSYYDLRAAQNAMQTLRSKSLGHLELDVQFYIPKDNASAKDLNKSTLMLLDLDPSLSNDDDLLRIFGVYGDVKEINESPCNHSHKLVEFYDVRATEAALNSLNGADIAGKKIKVERCPGGANQSLMRPISSDVSQDYSQPECYASIPMGAVSTGGIDNGALDLHSVLQAAIRPMMEAPFHDLSSNGLHSFSSPIRVASVGSHNNRSNHVDASHSVGQLNFGSQGVRPLLPHSLPDYHDGLTSSIPFSSSSISSRTADVMEHRHNHRVVSNRFNSHALEHHEGAFGVSGAGTCPVHGHQFVWNSSSSYPNQPAASTIWPNSPSFVNTITGNPAPQQIHGLPRNPSHLLNAILPLHHHVGSAPSMNPSLWDRRQYSIDSIEGPGFYVGSLGNGFPAHLNLLEFSSRNMLHGNCIDTAVSSPIGMPSRNMLNGRNHIIPMPSSYDAASERMRGRRSEGSSNLSDNNNNNNKQFELDLDRIARGEDSRTTLMIKNIPNKYTSKMLLAAIDEHHWGTYDFIYLPIDFKNKCNVGYAFINMVNPQHIISFYQTFNGKKWEKFNSEKVASLAYARIQGKQALIAHFQNSSLMNEDKRCRPILFCTEGPNAGDQEPFPVGVNIRLRPGRSRTNNNEDNHYEAPSLATSGAEPSGTAGSTNETES